MLLLYLFRLDESNFENEKFLIRVVDLMRTYFIRRNITDKPPTRQMDQGLIDLVEACAAKIKSGLVLEFEWFVEKLFEYVKPATVDEFRASLEGDIYKNNTWMPTMS